MRVGVRSVRIFLYGINRDSWLVRLHGSLTTRSRPETSISIICHSSLDKMQSQDRTGHEVCVIRISCMIRVFVRVTYVTASSPRVSSSCRTLASVCVCVCIYIKVACNLELPCNKQPCSRSLRQLAPSFSPTLIILPFIIRRNDTSSVSWTSSCLLGGTLCRNHALLPCFIVVVESQPPLLSSPPWNSNLSRVKDQQHCFQLNF